MSGFWPIFFLGVVLKVPVGLAIYLVWWAIRAEVQPDEAPESDDDGRFRRFRREPKRPRDPRRGPHTPSAKPLPACPPGGRLRVYPRPASVRVAAHGRQRGTAAPERRR
ncbi:hypothetical protein HJD18_02125 [Thermoleophilia bacterium SCSIO 60948]|nr:hypothetical protein HJD18_02125 [Thermoleophilia bacterium SCSIO 60948]